MPLSCGNAGKTGQTQVAEESPRLQAWMKVSVSHKRFCGSSRRFPECPSYEIGYLLFTTVPTATGPPNQCLMTRKQP
jgi:hypothetical protein